MSYWIFLLLLVDFQSSLIATFGDIFKALRRTVWHWMNFIDGGQILRPNLFRVMKTVLSVPDIGISSH